MLMQLMKPSTNLTVTKLLFSFLYKYVSLCWVVAMLQNDFGTHE